MKGEGFEKMSHFLIKLELLKKINKEHYIPNKVERAFLDQYKVLHLIDEVLVSHSKQEIVGAEGISQIREYMNKFL